VVDSSTRKQIPSRSPSSSQTSRRSARGLMMALLARLKLAHKLLIFSAALALPIVLMLYSAVSEYNEQIRYTRKELEGARQLEPLRQIAEDVRTHQRLDYLRLKGDLRWESQRKEAAQRIDAALARETAPQLAAQWQQLRTHPAATPAQSMAAHQQLAAGVRDLLRELGDSSGLVLDPDLDSYYLMELTVTLLPDAQATIAKAAMLANQEALGEPVSQRNQLQFASYADALENSTLPQVRHAVETSLREDIDFHGVSESLQHKLPGLLSGYESALTTCTEHMRQYSQTPNSSVTAPQLAAAADRAAQAGWDFQRASIVELQVLLNKRISDLHWKRTVALGSGILCAATLLGLLWAAHQYHVRQLARQFNLTLEARISERTRLARELQDTLLQTFQAVLPLFQTAIYKLPEDAVDARKNLELALERTSEAIGETRDAVMGLSMSNVEEPDLGMAIRTIGDELALAENSEISTSFQVLVEGTPRDLHPILRDEIFRLAAEALRNAFRHAAARNIEVEIRYHEKYFRLRVRDDGKGISPDVLHGEERQGNYGLPGMKERAALVGGKLTIWSEVDTGTEIELIIPASTAYNKPTRRFWQFRNASATDTDVNETIERE
jgi:signal transduction histidine kinase